MHHTLYDSSKNAQAILLNIKQGRNLFPMPSQPGQLYQGKNIKQEKRKKRKHETNTRPNNVIWTHETQKVNTNVTPKINFSFIIHRNVSWHKRYQTSNWSLVFLCHSLLVYWIFSWRFSSSSPFPFQHDNVNCPRCHLFNFPLLSLQFKPVHNFHSWTSWTIINNYKHTPKITTSTPPPPKSSQQLAHFFQKTWWPIQNHHHHHQRVHNK